jgi:hypothetical protein
VLRPPKHKQYRRAAFDTGDGDSASRIKCAFWGLLFAVPAAVIIGAVGGPALGAIVGAGVWFLAYKWLQFIANSAGGAMRAVLMPSGYTTPYQEGFSDIEALIVRGEFEAAAERWEAAIAERVGDVEVRVRAAEFYLREYPRPERALASLREVQGWEHTSPERELYVTQRLVDLYLGPLQQPGRALVELRRIVERFPGSTAARFAREGMRTIKEQLHGPTYGA